MENKIITTIVDYGYDGEGVGKLNGKVCFIPYALKGEQVELKIVDEKKEFIDGKLEKVILPSDKRIKAKCPYFSICGGCSYQNIDYSEELKIKRELAERQLKKLNYYNEINVISSPKPYSYRNKIKLFVADKRIGLKKRNSNEICEIDNCELVQKQINNTLHEIKNFVRENNLYQKIENIIIRQENDECLINFYVKNLLKDNILKQLYKRLGINNGLYQTYNQKKIYVCGLKFLEKEEFSLTCRFSPYSFHQVNNEVCNMLYRRILEEVSDENVINCYSGNGVLSGVLCKKCKNVTAIELGKSEHKEAELLKQLNNLTNLTNINGDCGEILPKLVDNFETIIIDPPRKGVDKKVIQAIRDTNFKKLIYVSCNVATLVRDLQRLGEFKIESIELYDMFARTGEYEMLAIISKSKKNNK